ASVNHWRRSPMKMRRIAFQRSARLSMVDAGFRWFNQSLIKVEQSDEGGSTAMNTDDQDVVEGMLRDIERQHLIEQALLTGWIVCKVCSKLQRREVKHQSRPLATKY